jgi:type IV pilus assembly protein PilC
MVVNMSHWLIASGYQLLFIIGGIIGTVMYFQKRSLKFRQWIDRTMLKMPVVGDILVKASIARFARTLSTMFTAGVPLFEALESVAGATGNIVYQDATMKMKEQVGTGQQLNLAMAQSGLFPNMVVQMIAIGEESGAIDSMADKVADFFEAEVDDAVDNLSALMEPMIMAILGILVGGLVVAMYLPIFKLGSVV